MDESRIAASPAAAEREGAGAAQPELSQVDVTLEHLGRLCARLEQAEQRFKQMTDECGEVLEGLVSVDRRHATTLATLNDRLSDWCNIERKLLEESARRIERFERGVEHEWTALRRLHEEPITDLREQADKLRLACLDAARLARQRLDAAEQSYTLQTRDFERRTAEWMQRALEAASGRALPTGSAAATSAPAGLAAVSSAPVEPWPLEEVAQLHQELRSATPPPARTRQAPTAVVDEDVRDYGAQVVGAPPRISERPTTASEAWTAEAVSADSTPETRTHASRGPARIIWAVSAIALGLVLFVAASYINQMQRRLIDLEAKASQAVAPRPPSDPPAEPAPGAAPVEPRTPDARQATERAGAIVDILAAPDLVRYDLAGVGPGQGAYGQVLWSRSHGMALTAVRLPVVAGRVYRVWVSREDRTASPGVLATNGAGSVRLIVPGPLTLPRPGTIVVTLENAAAADRATGPIYLTRVPTS